MVWIGGDGPGGPRPSERLVSLCLRSYPCSFQAHVLTTVKDGDTVQAAASETRVPSPKLNQQRDSFPSLCKVVIDPPLKHSPSPIPSEDDDADERQDATPAPVLGVKLEHAGHPV